ncbi:hypothetical protein VNO78_02871 [Psophocarpus tetragonolobus]|uniref:Uncharacterized protein n=1 Tax=Psophocarpus tetragonolobus TaxID=3891 RepID=A0AAN9XVL0_PSOTE
MSAGGATKSWLLVVTLTIVYLLSYEVISSFIPCALFSDTNEKTDVERLSLLPPLNVQLRRSRHESYLGVRPLKQLALAKKLAIEKKVVVVEKEIVVEHVVVVTLSPTPLLVVDFRVSNTFVQTSREHSPFPSFLP